MSHGSDIQNITQELRNFICLYGGYNQFDSVSIIDITKCIISYCHNFNIIKKSTILINFPIDYRLGRKESYDLFDRIIYPNEELKKLFNIYNPFSVYHSLQKNIEKHIID